MWFLIPFLAPTPEQTTVFDQLLRRDEIPYTRYTNIHTYANGVCEEMREGYNFNEIIPAVQKDLSVSRDLADRFASDAVIVFCPEYTGKMVFDRQNVKLQ